MTPDDLGSTARDGASSSAPRDNLTDISSSRNRENGRHTRWTGNVLDTGATPGGKNGSLANGNGHGSGGKNGDRQRGTPAAVRQTQGYTYSDRGKAAALETIAAQESAKKVAAWLNGLSAGGVAVVEARGSGWASTRHGREGLPGFLRQTAGPDVGVLWVEVLPSGLYHHGSSSCSNGGSSTGADDPLRSPTLLPYSSPLFTRTGGSGHPQTAAAHRSSGGTATGAAETTENGVGGAWKSVNGLPRGVPKGLGGNVVDTFLQSGSLVGAGGHVIYESVRRGARGGAGGAGGKGKSCFVSLADQGLDVQSQLQYEACPLAERVGTFAGALRMKKSWHGCPVYLTRHGESLGNQTKSMGGDGNLSETGDRYAGVLADFVAAQLGAGQSRLLVWCSPMKRATQTARAVKCHRYSQWQALTELDTGVFNGCSYKQVERDYPDEFTAREVDKLCYRYPEGEGYLDVVNRLDPVVVALEKEDRPVIVVSHQAVLRCLYAYFHDISLREMPRIPISLHTVVKLTPVDYHPEASAAGAAAGAAGGGARFWKELRFELIQQTPLQHLVEAAAVSGGRNRRTSSQLGERLS
ncbi:6-phosphofructo-2-kinase/fructose-2,6-bisphosphatase [Ectocarpus siliculosus]|uniref:6-phosphofructo-2-kinase/fructose-2,6-bisphosphat ase n=1 Tax=Ectocarpus siliculosus TaxID=2880 RepID=D8LFR1_ECTSI|nr:6-phosphofructo-2-kinase/fructose-2,6-bisphosphatase [Ectocarpus siliculosus]|eukprot:CBN75635.1 6-phosphofructo-2-kinase/fructose-2,6-bisphosphatase [Ectocarpus siliculosus]